MRRPRTKPKRTQLRKIHEAQALRHYMAARAVHAHKTNLAYLVLTDPSPLGKV